MPSLVRRTSRATASLAVSSPSTFSRSWAATSAGRYQLPTTCPLSVSHALRALLRPGPAGLVSCRSRPWGYALQGRSPPAEPHILSDAVALLGFTSRRDSRLDHPGCRRYRGTLGDHGSLSGRRCFRRSAPLQGLAPCERPLLRANCLGRPGSATLVGFLLLRDFSFSAGDLPRSILSRASTSARWALPSSAPQSLDPAEKSAWLSRACYPLRGSATSSTFRILCRAGDPGSPLGDRSLLPAC
jgi:hypothetical protein